MKFYSNQASVTAALIASATICFAIWALSPWAAGREEAFNVGYYYIPAMLGAGFASGLLVGKPAWAHYLGCVVGQLLYLLLVLKVGWLILPSLIFVPIASLLFFVSALGAIAMRRNYRPLA